MEIPEVILSTFFIPQLRVDPLYTIVGGEVIGTDIDPDVAPSLIGVNTNNNATRNRLIAEYSAKGGRFSSHLAACTRETRQSPFPCRTSVLHKRCLDGNRKCSTAEHNGYEPFIELDFHHTDQQNFYPHLLVMHIPPNEEYGTLVFHALGDDVQANRGWRVELFDGNHTKIEVPVLEWNIGANVAEHSEGLSTVQHALFGGITSDATYEAASRARFVRVTLIGQLRQLWLDNIELFIRDVPEKLV